MRKIETFTGGVAATNAFFCQSSGTNFLVDAPEGTARWLEEGDHRIDALLLTHNPLQDITNTQKIAGVFLKGTWHNKTQINKELQNIKQRAQKSKEEK